MDKITLTVLKIFIVTIINLAPAIELEYNFPFLGTWSFCYFAQFGKTEVGRAVNCR